MALYAMATLLGFHCLVYFLYELFMKKWLIFFEWAVGGLAVALGLYLSVLLYHQGIWVPGALMLVVTGILLCGIAWKDQKGILYNKVSESLMIVIRRTLLFLNFMLSLVVVLTLLGGFS